MTSGDGQPSGDGKPAGDRPPARPAGPDAPGELIVVATPIGNIGDLSPRGAAALESADVVCCEDTRHTGQLLARLGLRASRLLSMHAHNERERTAQVLEMLGRGARVALVSDAGTPAMSDPGERLISSAIAAGHKVTSVPGPSAAVTALVVAGLGTARWRFEGFLPRRGADRAGRLEEIAAARHPSVIYEAPQRIAATLEDLASRCGGDRKVAVCRELTKRFEETWHGTLAEAFERGVGDPAARRARAGRCGRAWPRAAVAERGGGSKRRREPHVGRRKPPAGGSRRRRRPRRVEASRLRDLAGPRRPVGPGR